MPQDVPDDGNENGSEPGIEVMDQAENPTVRRSGPVLHAAVDVDRLLSQATGLQRIVHLAEQVAADGSPGHEEVPVESRGPAEASAEQVGGSSGAPPPT